MHAVQLATTLLAVAAATASAFPGGFGGYSHSHVSVSDGGADGGHGGYAGGYEEQEHQDYYAHPQYKYEYAVHDPHTGDVKSHSESRDGESVKGSYSLTDADGHERTVEYVANKHTGFQAVVKKGGKVSVHGHGKADEHNNAELHAIAAGHAAAAAASAAAAGHGAGHGGAGYSHAISHGVSYGGKGSGYGSDLGSFGHAHY